MSNVYYFNETKYDFIQYEFINGTHYLLFADHVYSELDEGVILNADTQEFTITFDTVYEVAENVDKYDWYSLNADELKSVELLLNFIKDEKETLEDILMPFYFGGSKSPWEV